MENIQQIIQGCINKDSRCQKALYEYARAFALKIVFRYIYRYEKAINVVNDGFVKLFNNFHDFKTADTANNERILMGWLKKIMINTSIDYLRKGDMLPEIGGIPESVWEYADYGNSADQAMLYNDLIAMIKELPPNHRIVFNLYVIDGYSHIEIAEMINTTAGNSKSILSRAKSLLQKKIKKTESAKICRI